MPRNKLKAMAQNKKIKLGHFIVEFATPGIGHIMKAAGCEFALFDLWPAAGSVDTHLS